MSGLPPPSWPSPGIPTHWQRNGNLPDHPHPSQKAEHVPGDGKDLQRIPDGLTVTESAPETDQGPTQLRRRTGSGPEATLCGTVHDIPPSYSGKGYSPLKAHTHARPACGVVRQPDQRIVHLVAKAAHQGITPPSMT